jgi:hypothetical protein
MGDEVERLTGSCLLSLHDVRASVEGGSQFMLLNEGCSTLRGGELIYE